MPINQQDVPTDSSKMESDAEVILAENDVDLINALLIIGQLDPTEVDLTNGKPRWNEDQRDLIVKAVETVNDWQS